MPATNTLTQIKDQRHLEDILSAPSDIAIDAMRRLDGDIIMLGVTGKMGPTLARMAVRASVAAGVDRRVLGVSRFTEEGKRATLERHGVETIQGDLSDESFVDSLPNTANVISLVGSKFGTCGNESLTWSTNVYLATLIARKFSNSRIAAFSTGNVYGLVPVVEGGSKECDPLSPVGEYAISTLARERMYECLSEKYRFPLSLLRLNYAVEMRYGVLLDIGLAVFFDQPIDLSMGHVNVIWQADANGMVLAALADASRPPFVINIGGPEILSVREIAQSYAESFGKQVRFVGRESTDALLNNATKSHEKYGLPAVSASEMMTWITDWIESGGVTYGKKTCYESRNGKF